MILLIYKKI